jgi:serine/threonine protein phosphatase PrpC
MKIVHARPVTDTGKKRRRNEDAFVVQPPLFAVADGMGGAQAGEIASKLAAAALKENGGDSTDGERRVHDLIQEANRRVYQRSNEDASYSGMGTTVTVALVDEAREIVTIGHVGDSRAYLIRDGRIEQLTEDHSLVAELMRDGRLSPEEAETHPQRSVITRALGTDPDVDVDSFSVEARPGDLFLLCSDGLTTMVSDEDILDQLERSQEDLDSAARALVAAANRRGGEDNITIILFRVMEGAAQAAEVTRELPRHDEPEPADELEEDTLTEADAVPAVDTMVLAPEQVQAMLREGGIETQDGGRRRERASADFLSAAAVLGALAVFLVVILLVVWGFLT